MVMRSIRRPPIEPLPYGTLPPGIHRVSFRPARTLQVLLESLKTELFIWVRTAGRYPFATRAECRRSQDIAMRFGPWRSVRTVGVLSLVRRIGRYVCGTWTPGVNSVS